MKVLAIQHIDSKLDDANGRQYHQTFAQFKCPWCGNEFWMLASKGKRRKSCGCRAGGAHLVKHGLFKHPLHAVWSGMIRRCRDRNVPIYKYYGGRGIKVCNQWRSFLPFYTWAMSHGYDKGLQIDRRKNDGNYTPRNCRFVTHTQQTQNRGSYNVVNATTVTDLRNRRKQGESCASLAICFGLKRNTVNDIVARRTWNNIP